MTQEQANPILTEALKRISKPVRYDEKYVAIADKNQTLFHIHWTGSLSKDQRNILGHTIAEQLNKLTQ